MSPSRTASPRIFLVAGDTLSVHDLPDVLTEATRHRFRPLRAGSVRTLAGLAALLRDDTPDLTWTSVHQAFVHDHHPLHP